MIAAYGSSAPTCIIHARGDELHILTAKCPIPTQFDNPNYDPSFSAIRYTPPERCNEQVDHHNAVKQLDEISETDWGETLTLPDEYSAKSEKFINMLTWLKSMSDGHPGSIRRYSTK